MFSLYSGVKQNYYSFIFFYKNILPPLALISSLNPLPAPQWEACFPIPIFLPGPGPTRSAHWVLCLFLPGPPCLLSAVEASQPQSCCWKRQPDGLPCHLAKELPWPLSAHCTGASLGMTLEPHRALSLVLHPGTHLPRLSAPLKAAHCSPAPQLAGTLSLPSACPSLASTRLSSDAASPKEFLDSWAFVSLLWIRASPEERSTLDRALPSGGDSASPRGALRSAPGAGSCSGKQEEQGVY